MIFLHHSWHRVVSHHYHKSLETNIITIYTPKQEIDLHGYDLNIKLKHLSLITSFTLQKMKPQRHAKAMQRANSTRLFIRTKPRLQNNS